MGIRLATTSSPAEIAWAAYDAAAIQLNLIYTEIASGRNAPINATARFELAMETARLWSAFRDIVTEDDGGPGAAA